MSLYQQQREQVKKSIQVISISIFKQKGYENSTIDEITKEVGIAKGTFYNFYSSKSDILLSWAVKKFQVLDFREAINKENTLEENLFKFIELLVKEIEAEMSLFHSFLIEILKNYKDSVKNKEFDFLSIYKLIIINSKDQDYVINNLLEEKIAVLNSAIFMAIINFINMDSSDSLELYLKKITKVCLYGLLDRMEGVE